MEAGTDAKERGEKNAKEEVSSGNIRVFIHYHCQQLVYGEDSTGRKNRIRGEDYPV